MPEFHDTLALAAHPRCLALALAWLKSAAQRNQWPEQAAFSLALCLDEALSNILAHAARPAGSNEPLSIKLDCRSRNGSIVLEVQDNGTPFDPTTATSPPLAATLDEARPGGHGLRLMHHYLESLHYQRLEGWNCLRMTVPLA